MFDKFYIRNKPSVPAIKVASVNEAKKLSRTRYLWIIDGANDYSDFDFTYEPVPWEDNQTHVWASQWQENGGTYLIPKNSEETNYNQKVITCNKVTVPFIFLDFNNADSSKSYKTISNVSSNVVKTRFISSYHGTLARIINKIESEYVWVTTSVCDYSNFDFTWHPSEWHTEMFHVFPSNEQKFGDTFYIHVPTFKEQVNKIELLEWYETIHFVKDINVPRWRIPYVQVNDNSIVSDVKNYDFIEPVVLFTDNINVSYEIPTINLWREKTRTVTPLSDGANTCLTPRDAKNHILTQVYDYPFISKKHVTYNDTPLDIVFISNGESNAEENWDHLLSVTNGLPNKVKRVDGVKGRVNAYQEAAKSSDTAWFFACFAKLKVNKEFDWNWQPDRLQQNKHYIFHAKNPITGLEYGHMAMIAYHKGLVLSNTALGLDFTLDQEHEVVPILSGTAYYADSKEVAWRSAFREVLKLKDSNTIDNEYRLEKWLNNGNGDIGIWSKRGAEDAVEYYESVNGDFSKLKLSYDWEWLDEYFTKKHGVEHVL